MFALLAAFSAVFAASDLDKLTEIAQKRYGSDGKEILTKWIALMESASAQPETKKLLVVNDFFNTRVAFSTDRSIWGVGDYWATPLETMGLQRGDCEDFSIAKYISLLKLGVSLNKLRLTYVKANVGMGRAQAHMVLAYYPEPNADPLILDNLSTEILPASKRPDLVPVFSFNSAGLWVGGDTQPKVKQPETRLSRWRDVLTRMQAEGLQ